MSLQNGKWMMAAAVAGIVVSATTAAMAQNALDGRVLDRNLRTGSGGINNSNRGLAPGAYQDALVTGNVGGLARFRGRIDYKAPGEFSGRTAESDSFLFRQAALPSIIRTNHSGGSLNQFGLTPLLLRSGSGTTIGEMTGQRSRFSGAPIIRRDDYSSLILARPNNSNTLTVSLDDSRQRREPEQRLALEADPAGRVLEVTASPLQGVNRRVLDYSLPSGLLNNPEKDEEKANENASPEEQKKSKEEKLLTKARDRRITGGQLSDSRLGFSPEDDPLNLLPDQRVDALEQAMRRARQANPGKSEESVYYDLLRRARESQNAASGIAGDRLAASADKAKPSDPPVTGEIVPKVADAPATGKESESYKQFVARLRYDLPPLKSLATGSKTPFDKALTEAEVNMKNERYFQAESGYARAMSMPQSTPLAGVGYIHSQVGAGLYLSASVNLRRLFTAHPELIAARYADPVLPSEARLSQVEKDLETLVKSGGHRDLLLLTAYLAYQQGQNERMKKAMDGMAEERSRDPLLPLLRKIWVAERPSDKPKEDAPGAGK